MNRLEVSLIAFGILFILVFTIDYFLIKRKYLKRINGKSKRKRKKDSELVEIAYLTGKFKLKKEALNLNILLILFSIINAFIIALVSIVIILIRINVVLQLLIGFVLILALIYSLYEILGTILVKKGYDKDEYKRN